MQAIEAYKHYGEVEFTYRNNRYGILYNDFEKCDMLLNINTHEEQLYQSIDDLAKKVYKWYTSKGPMDRSYKYEFFTRI